MVRAGCAALLYLTEAAGYLDAGTRVLARRFARDATDAVCAGMAAHPDDAPVQDTGLAVLAALQVMR